MVFTKSLNLMSLNAPLICGSVVTCPTARKPVNRQTPSKNAYIFFIANSAYWILDY